MHLREIAYASGMPASFDPSKRPRRPRLRATKRRVAAPDHYLDTTDFPDLLPADTIKEIIGDLQLATDYTNVHQWIEEQAQEYGRSCDQPQTSRDVIGYELALLAHEVWRLSNTEQADSTVLRQMFNLWNEDAISPETCDLLAVRLNCPSMELIDRLDAGALSWTDLGEAAASAKAAMSGGDYTDANLFLAIQQLAEIYQAATGMRPTWSGASDGPIVGDGGQRRIGSSPCARFIHRFFHAVDPKVPISALDNSLRAMLETAHKQAT